MTMDRQEIAALIPHAGRMCLLERVLGWTAREIRCSTRTHRDAGHPLARDGALPAIAGLEYAAQAMALHGRLCGAATYPARSGFVVSVRDILWSAGRLDILPGPLTVEARMLAGDDDSALYEFRLSAEDMEVLSGRAAVLLSQGAA